MLLFVAVFFLVQQGVFGLEPGYLVVDVQEVGLEVSEVAEFLFEGRDDDVFVVVFGLLEGRELDGLVPFHLKIEYQSWIWNYMRKFKNRNKYENNDGVIIKLNTDSLFLHVFFFLFLLLPTTLVLSIILRLFLFGLLLLLLFFPVSLPVH